MNEGLRDLGLLVLRLGFGLNMLIFHGWDKLTAGPAKWATLGQAASWMGLGLVPNTALGLAGALGESLAPALIALGLFFRPALVLMGLTMLGAAGVHLAMPAGQPNAGLAGASHALLYLTACSGLFFTGPGKHALVLKKV